MDTGYSMDTGILDIQGIHGYSVSLSGYIL